MRSPVASAIAARGARRPLLLAGAHHRAGWSAWCVAGGADHVRAVQRDLGGDLLGLARVRERAVCDLQLKVLGDVVAVDDLTGTGPDRAGPPLVASRAARSPSRRTARHLSRSRTSAATRGPTSSITPGPRSRIQDACTNGAADRSPSRCRPPGRTSGPKRPASRLPSLEARWNGSAGCVRRAHRSSRTAVAERCPHRNVLAVLFRRRAEPDLCAGERARGSDFEWRGLAAQARIGRLAQQLLKEPNNELHRSLVDDLRMRRHYASHSGQQQCVGEAESKIDVGLRRPPGAVGG